MPAIVVKDGPGAGGRIELGDGETLLGRTSEFLSHDDEVSRRHASLRRAAGGVEIEDLGSANGTFVNDRRIQGPTSLSSGDVVRLGRTSLEVEIEAVEASATAPTFTPQPGAQAPGAAQPLAGAAQAGASGIGVTVAWLAFLAALLGVIWAINVLVYMIQGEPDTSAAWIVEGADLIVTIVAAALAVAGGIALLRGQDRGRLLVILGGASGVVGPAINAIYYYSRSDDATLQFFGWLGVVGAILSAAVLILALAAGSRLTRGQ